MTRRFLVFVGLVCATIATSIAVPQWGIATDDSTPPAYLRVDRFVQRFYFASGSGRLWLGQKFADVSPLLFLSLAVVGVVLSLRRKRWDLVAVGAIILPATIPLVELGLKPLVGRTSYGHFMYPSGHSSGAAASAMFVAVVLHQVAQPRTFRRLLPLLIGFPICEAFILTMLRAHWFTDTIGGIATGIGWIALGTAALLRFRRTDQTERIALVPR